MRINRLKEKTKEFTAPLRCLPDFIIIGAQKGGTSSLFSYLKQHPQIQLPNKKEIHFFDNQFDKGVNWYKSHFQLNIFKTKKTGEASPYYLFHPYVPERVFKLCPSVKLIVMLRNPADRAYSHYMMQNKRKIDPLQTFEEAIAAEEKRLIGKTIQLDNSDDFKSLNHQRLSYLERGKYYTQLKRWLKIFQRDQFLFIKSENFFKTPLHELEKVYAFLDIKIEQPSDLRPQNTNSYMPMNDETRDFLNTYFANENNKLAELLGNEFLWKS